MNYVLEEILSYIRGVWRYRWYALGAAWLICLAGWIFAYTLPDEYDASARVYVDTQSILRPLLTGLAVNVDPNAQIALMTRTLLSRPNLAKVARMTDLDLQSEDSESMDELLKDLKDQIELGGAGRENLYSITVWDKDPQLAKRVVQAVLTVFVENTLGETRQDSDTAQRFLDRQISEYEARLAMAEDRLKEFKRRNLGMMPNEGGSFYATMQQANANLQNVQLELQQATNRRDTLLQQVNGEEPSFGSGPAASSAVAATLGMPIQERINSLEIQLDSLLLKYTERHPDVINTRQIITDLEKQRDEQLAELAANMASQPDVVKNAYPELDTNPVYQHLKIALAEEEAGVSALQVRAQEYQRRLEDLQKRVHLIPEIEAQLIALNRDYDVTKKNYNALLSRRESAHLSQQAGQTTDDIRFKVIEPPRVPHEPSGPNRPLIMSGVLFGGVGASVALALLMVQIWPTFDTRHSLMRVTNLPVFGSVSMILPAAVMRRQRLLTVAYIFLAVSLLLIYAGLMALEITGNRIPLSWPW